MQGSSKTLQPTTWGAWEFPSCLAITVAHCLINKVVPNLLHLTPYDSIASLPCGRKGNVTRAAAGTVEFQAAKESPVLLGRHHLLENDSGFAYEHCLSTTQWPKFFEYLSTPHPNVQHKKHTDRSLSVRSSPESWKKSWDSNSWQCIIKWNSKFLSPWLCSIQWIDHWLGRNHAGILLQIWCLNVYTEYIYIYIIYMYVRYAGTAVPFCNTQKE